MTPQVAALPSRTLSEVYHVGDLSGERVSPTVSYEGSGVSVSLHPDIWTRISPEVGGESATTYTLSMDDGQFYEASPSGTPRERVVEWCLDNEYVHEIDGYRVQWEDNGVTHWMEFYAREKARREARREGREIVETDLLALGARGERYWSEAFTQEPVNADPAVIRDLTPVWFAEAGGFEGVWWDETLAPEDFSAPRGVIFQSALSKCSVSPRET